MRAGPRHALWIRWTHWLGAPVLGLMIWSGLRIYWANDVYPGFFPDRFFEVLGLQAELANGMAVHFNFAWVWTVLGAVYLIGTASSGHWRELAPGRSSRGGYSLPQRVAYTGVAALGVLETLSGLAIYKPVQLQGLALVFGGYEAARLVHFVAMLGLVLFVGVHVIQVARAGWPTLRGMITGFETSIGPWPTRRALAVYLLSAAVVIGGISAVVRAPSLTGGEEDIPAPLRKGLEWNGRVASRWQDLKRLSVARPPEKGSRPRVNGDIGLTTPIDLERWSLQVLPSDGPEALAPFTLSMAELRAMPRVESTAEFRCIEGWSEPISYAGVRFGDLVRYLRLKPKAYVGLETPDAEYYVSIDTESMMHPQTLLAYEMNGVPLRLDDGAPLRLVIPIKYGIKSIKRIGRLFFSDRRPRDYWAERGYDWFAGL